MTVKRFLLCITICFFTLALQDYLGLKPPSTDIGTAAWWFNAILVGLASGALARLIEVIFED